MKNQLNIYKNGLILKSFSSLLCFYQVICSRGIEIAISYACLLWITLYKQKNIKINHTRCNMYKPAQPPVIRQVQPELIIQGVEMIGQESVGILLGTKSKATVSEWLARAGLDGISINNRKYYAIRLIQQYLSYEKVEIREAIELLREIKILSLKSKKQGEIR